MPPRPWPRCTTCGAVPALDRCRDYSARRGAHNAAPSGSTGISPYEALFRAPPNTRPLVAGSATAAWTRALDCRGAAEALGSRARVGDTVLVAHLTATETKENTRLHLGPFKVTAILSGGAAVDLEHVESHQVLGSISSRRLFKYLDKPRAQPLTALCTDGNIISQLYGVTAPHHALPKRLAQGAKRAAVLKTQAAERAAAQAADLAAAVAIKATRVAEEAKAQEARAAARAEVALPPAAGAGPAPAPAVLASAGSLRVAASSRPRAGFLRSGRRGDGSV